MAFVLINSMVRHNLVEGQYRERRDDCESAARKLGVACLGQLSECDLAESLPRLSPREAKRCRHVVTENARVEAAAAALLQCDMIELGHLLNQSHASLRDDMQTSIIEVDQLADIAQATNGVFGARIMGGGFGGCVIALTRVDFAEGIAAAIAERFARTTGITPETHVCRAVDGAKEVSA
jgi:galactokinase